MKTNFCKLKSKFKKMIGKKSRKPKVENNGHENDDDENCSFNPGQISFRLNIKHKKNTKIKN